MRFVNLDRYDHHVRSLPGGPLGSIPPVKNFEYRLTPPRKGGDTSADLRFDTAGHVVLGCHLHNSMRGHVVVSPTPWFAITDANGRATIANVPAGAADARTWHPDQIVEQAATRLQIDDGVIAATARLNFTPRQRPAPRAQPKGEYDVD